MLLKIYLRNIHMPITGSLRNHPHVSNLKISQSWPDKHPRRSLFGPSQQLFDSQTRQSKLSGLGRKETSRHDSPPNADIHFAPERGGWGSLRRRRACALPAAPSSVEQAATTRAGTGCGCGHQRRTPEPLVNQRQGTGVQLIKLSLWEMCEV